MWGRGGVLWRREIAGREKDKDVGKKKNGIGRKGGWGEEDLRQIGMALVFVFKFCEKDWKEVVLVA